MRLLMGARSPSTFKNWDLALRRYTLYCDNIRLSDVDRWPPSSHIALGFLAFLFGSTDATHGMAKSALGGVRSICDFMGLDTKPLDSPLLDFALKTFRKVRPSKKRTKRAPITIPILRILLGALTGTPIHVSMVKAVATAMTYALLRPQDATETDDYPGWFPKRADITWFDDHFVFHLSRSKNDVFAEGVDIPVYSNGSDTCPWRCMLGHWLLAPDQSPSAPLFQCDPAGAHLRYADLLQITKHLATRAGLRDKAHLYSPHSFRIGGATSLAIAGASDYTVKNAGRWSSLSYQLYTRPSARELKRVSLLMAGIPSIDSGRIFSPDGYGGTDPSALLEADVEDVQMIISS